MDNSVTVKVQVTEDGEYFIGLPDDVVDELDMLDGCIVEWIDNNDGSFTVQKVV